MARPPARYSRVSVGYINSAETVAQGDAGDTGTNLSVAGGSALDTLTVATTFAITSPTAPASGLSTAAAGTIAFDDDYLYIATSANSWRQVAISEF